MRREVEFAQVVLGENGVPIDVLLEDEDGFPFDLSGATQIEVRLPGAACGAFVSKLLTGGSGGVTIQSAGAGWFRFVVVGSDALRVGDRQDVEVLVTLTGGGLRVCQLLRSFTVKPRRYPSP